MPNIIETWAQKIGGYTYNSNVPSHNSGTWNEEVGYGLVNAYVSVTKALSAPSINGSDEVCYNGSQFTLSFTPPNPIYWTVSDPSLFELSSSTNTSTIVTRKGSGVGSATLTARSGTTIVASRVITACPALTIVGSDIVCYGSSKTFTVANAPAGFTWNKSFNLSITGTGSSVTVSVNSSSISSLQWVSINSSAGIELIRNSAP